MKRALAATFFCGLIAAVVAIALHKTGVLFHSEGRIDHWTFGQTLPNENLGPGNYLLIVVLAFAVSWTVLEVTEWPRRAALVALVVAELFSAAWIFSLGDIHFQPLPAVAVTIFAALLALIPGFTAAGRRYRAYRRLFAGRLSGAQMNRLAEKETPDLSAPGAHEVSFVYCQIENQDGLMDELTAPEYARLMRRLVELAADFFLREGGYLHAADGEGIRVLFGFPHSLGNHAAAAARAALAFRDRLAVLAFREPDSLGKVVLRIGISAGEVVASLPEEKGRGPIVISGDPLERARRIALANQIYGSRMLLGPRAFDLAGKEIVARPIDFLRSGEAHERLEVYELLALASDASAEEMAARDSFWKALVYFRERRWTDAFTEFNRARRANSENDAPLQWYLRRLEPIMLHMANEPLPAPDPFAPQL